VLVVLPVELVTDALSVQKVTHHDSTCEMQQQGLITHSLSLTHSPTHTHSLTHNDSLVHPLNITHSQLTITHSLTHSQWKLQSHSHSLTSTHRLTWSLTTATTVATTMRDDHEAPKLAKKESHTASRTLP
jgi:hypothetical protein